MVNASDDALNESLSAIRDGQGTAADWARVNAAWSRDPALRERWAAWQAVSDGLHAPDLWPLKQDPEALLAALHAGQPESVVHRGTRRDWLAPLAVAATFVAMAVGIGALRPAPAPEVAIATAPISTPPAQGLNGLSFAQTAAGRTLPADAPPEVIDWGLSLPEPAASQARP